LGIVYDDGKNTIAERLAMQWYYLASRIPGREVPILFVYEQPNVLVVFPPL